MTAANERRYDTDILDTLAQRVVVGDGATGTQSPAADPTLHDCDNGFAAVKARNTFGCKLVNLGNYDIADNPQAGALGHRGRQAARVELGVRTSGGNVDFSGREALQRFRAPARIRHARQSQGRLPLWKECT
ncbi:hypothetical protein [Mycobacterium sp.]|uniref:hypothetical protein n=1 Tax=Mycobacterium sp. TaxID=1785 RepID=UPI00121A657B|nr:hypothetical protein [Mycobacterium sp.]TAM67365.1 MAG: hypothetical protein EPN51_15480 [Mycobacterium sp.]